MDGRVGRRSERAEQQKNVILFDEFAHLLHRLRRTVTIIAADEVDATTVYPPLFVEHIEIGGFGFANDAVGGGRPLYGIVLPILISLSVTPGCSAAEPTLVARTTLAIASMIVSFSLKLMNVLPVRHVLIVIMGKASRSSK